MMTPETQARAQAVFDYIHAHPEQHDQGSISACGTSMCIAGTAAWLEWGAEAHNHISERGGLRDACGPLLGLSATEAEYLFFETMDEERAVQLLKHAVVGEPLPIPDDYEAEGY